MVRLKGNGVPASRVRSLAPSGWLIGRSVHSLEEAAGVSGRPGVDYVALGTVFETVSKPGRRPLGLTGLRQAVSVLKVPVLAIGGIDLDRVPAVAESGAAGFAAVGFFSSLVGATPWEFRKSVEKILERWNR